MMTLTENGIPYLSNSNSCNTVHAVYALNADISVRESKKKEAPVRWLLLPNRLSRYSYNETTFSR